MIYNQVMNRFNLILLTHFVVRNACCCIEHFELCIHVIGSTIGRASFLDVTCLIMIPQLYFVIAKSCL